MSNKTQLQQNNIELQEHLQDIFALPNVNDVKNGQYAWEKLSKKRINAKIIPNENSPFSVKVVGVNDGDIVDYSTVNLVGVSFDLMLPTGVKSTTIVINDSTTATAGGTSTSTYTFDTETGIITFASSGWSMGSATYIEPINIPCQGYSFECYVLSDDESAYPNDGEKDGYWYRNVDKEEEEEVNPELTTGTVTVGAVSEITIEHGLGKVPSLVFIVRDGQISTTPNNTFAAFYPFNNTISTYEFIIYGGAYNYKETVADEDKVIMKCSTLHNWGAGTYTWMAKA